MLLKNPTVPKRYPHSASISLNFWTCASKNIVYNHLHVITTYSKSTKPLAINTNMMSNIESDSDDSLHEIMALSLITARVNDNLEYNPSIAKALRLKQEEFRQRRLHKQKMKEKKKKEEKLMKEDNKISATKSTTTTLPKSESKDMEPCSKRDSKVKGIISRTSHNEENDNPRNEETSSIVGVAQALISLKPSKEATSTTSRTSKNSIPKKHTPRKTRSMRRRRNPPRLCKNKK